MLIAVLEKNVSFIIIFGTLFPYRPGIFNLWSATPRGASRGPRATPEKLETRRILTKQNTGYINAVGTGYTYRIENFAGVCYAMSFGYAILITHVLAQPGVRKVEAGAPWAVGSATRASNICGVHSVTKVENRCTSATLKVSSQLG